jgi:hypothetical protein
VAQHWLGLLLSLVQFFELRTGAHVLFGACGPTGIVLHRPGRYRCPGRRAYSGAIGSLYAGARRDAAMLPMPVPAVEW